MSSKKVPAKKGILDAKELGVIAGLVFRNFVTGEVVNTNPVSYSELKRITQQDGQARGLLRLLTMPITNAKWDILSSEEDIIVSQGKGRSKEIVGSTSNVERDFIAKNMFKPAHEGGMTVPFKEVVTAMALAVRDGFKVFEKVWDLDDRNKIYLRKLAIRDNDSVTLQCDRTGDYSGFHQQCYFSGEWIDVEISKEKSLLYTFGKEENPLYGVPLFLPVYYHVDKKHKLYYISHIAYQMLAVPPRIGTYPTGSSPEVRNKLLADMATIGFNAAMTIPEGVVIEPFESKRSLADFIPLIDHHNTMAAKAVLGQFMDLATSATGRLAGEQSDVFIMGIVSVLEDIEKEFNNWVFPQLIDFNFGSKSYPKLRARAFTDSEQETIKEVFKEIMTAGASHCSPEFMAKLEQKMASQLDIKDINYDEVEAKMIKQAEEERKLANAKMSALTTARAAGGTGGNPNKSGKKNKPGDGKEGNA